MNVTSKTTSALLFLNLTLLLMMTSEARPRGYYYGMRPYGGEHGRYASCCFVDIFCATVCLQSDELRALVPLRLRSHRGPTGSHRHRHSHGVAHSRSRRSAMLNHLAYQSLRKSFGIKGS